MEKESDLLQFAERELKLAGLDRPDSVYDGAVYNAVMELIRVFANQGRSGYSAGLVVQIFSRLAKYEPLLPLTGQDDEWVESYADGLLQNKRDYSVFKENGVPFHSDAIIWRDPSGFGFLGLVEGVQSSQKIVFPFMPKTFYVDVDYENKEYRIKDWSQLREAQKYYPFLELPEEVK